MKIVEHVSQVPLTYLEAQILHHHVWKGLPLQYLGDLLGTPPGALTAAYRSMLAKVAERLGPMEEAIAAGRLD